MPEQVIRKLWETDRMLGEGKTTAEVAKALEVSENTYHRWQRQYGGMKAAIGCRRRERPYSVPVVSSSSPSCVWAFRRERGAALSRTEWLVVRTSRPRTDGVKIPPWLA